MIGLIDSKDIEYNGTENEALFQLVCDSASDLIGLTHYDNIKIRIGSECTDISTGDKYLKSSTAWVQQPSSNVWENVYTKAEVDTMFTAYYTAAQIDTKLLQYYTMSEVDEKLAHKAAVSFTPGGTIGNILNCTFTIPDSSRSLRFTIGKLNATQNYLQIYVNGVDKGYLVFDVSRNIDNWGE